jgi:MFS family permease
VTAAVSLPIGFLLPRIGYRRGLLLASGLLVAAFLGWALLPCREVLIAGSVLGGLASALLFIVSSPLMGAASRPENRTHLFGVQFALSTLVGVAANLAGGHLPRLFASGFGTAAESPDAYRAVLLAATALVLASALPAAGLRGLGSEGTRQPLRVAGLGASGRTFAKLATIQLTCALGAGMLMPFVNVFYKLRFGLSDPTLGAAFAASSLMTGLAALVAPLVAARVGKVRAVVLVQALSIPFLLATGFAPWVGVSVGAFLVRTALMNMSSPVFMAFTMGLVPAGLRPLLTSLLALAWNGGWALSAWASGQIQVSSGFGPLFAITGGFYVASVAMTYVLFRNAVEVEEPGVVEQLHVDEEARV